MTIDTIDPLRIDELDGQLGQSSRSLVERLNALRESAASVTTEETHLYANGDTGNDEDTGRSPDKPKKTLEAVTALIPDLILHHVVVHLRGTFTETGSFAVSGKHTAVKYTQPQWPDTRAPALIIDGGPDYQVVADNGGAGWAVTGGSATEVIVAGTPWTTDEHGGYIVEVIAGNNVGETRMVHKQTNNTITPHKDWVDLTGQTIRIVKPATTIDGLSDIVFNDNLGVVIAQRLALVTPWIGVNRSTNVAFTGITSEVASGNGLLLSGPGLFSLSNEYVARDPNNPDTILDPLPIAVSMVGADPTIDLRDWSQVALSGTYFKADTRIRHAAFLAYRGARFVGEVWLRGTVDYSATVGSISSGSGYQPIRFAGSATSGLLVDNGSVVTVSGAAVFENNTAHGIEVKKGSSLHFEGTAPTGSGNTGAGVYAHTKALVTIEDGETPTVTGTVGDVSLDGTTEESTWADIDAGKGILPSGDGHYGEMSVVGNSTATSLTVQNQWEQFLGRPHQ
jgi:hypothetical protein